MLSVAYNLQSCDSFTFIKEENLITCKLFLLQVDVGPYKETKIRCYGPGLQGGIVGYPADFTVETNGETGALGFSIEGPSQAKIDCKDNGDGSADISYYPTAPGEYAVHVLCNEEDIPKSPWMADIQPNMGQFDAGKVIATGPGNALSPSYF